MTCPASARSALPSLLSLTAALAACASAQQVPASLEVPAAERCVFDRVGLFDATSARSLQETCAAVNRGGAGQLVIEAVGSLRGKTVKEFAQDLFVKYRLGHAGLDDGLLVVVAGAPGKRAVRIHLDHGLEPGIPDAKAGALLDERYLPELREHGEGPATVELLRELAPLLEREARSDYVRSGQASRDARAAGRTHQ